jgi:hypothetical protein
MLSLTSGLKLTAKIEAAYAHKATQRRGKNTEDNSRKIRNCLPLPENEFSYVPKRLDSQ